MTFLTLLMLADNEKTLVVHVSIVSFPKYCPKPHINKVLCVVDIDSRLHQLGARFDTVSTLFRLK